MRSANNKRSYESPLRKEQRAATREKLVAAATAFLKKHDPSQLSLSKIAKAAKVSVGAVYVHFPSEDDLLLEVLLRVDARVRTDAPLHIARLDAEPFVRFPRFARERKLVSFAAHFAPFQKLRAPNRVKVKAMVVEQLRLLAPSLTDAELESVSGPIFAMLAPRVWHYFEDVWSMSTKESARAAAWAIRAMLNELERDPQSFRNISSPQGEAL